MTKIVSSAQKMLALMLCGMMLPFMLLAAVQEASFKKDGKPFSKLGKSACSSSEQIEVVLPNEVLNDAENYTDFSGYVRSYSGESKKANGEDICGKSLPDAKRRDLTFTKPNPHVELGKLIKSGQCSGDAKPGLNVLCIYDDTGTKFLTYHVYSYNTAQAKFGSISDQRAANGEVSFRVNTSGGTSPKEIKVCYGKDEHEKIGEGDCGDGFTAKEYKPGTIITIGDLENKAKYGFKVKLIQPDGEEGRWEDPFWLTPIPVAYVLQGYNGSGGELQFSCQQSGTKSSLFLFLTLIFLLLLRLRKSSKHVFTNTTQLGLAVILLLGLTPTKAHAKMNIGLLGAMYRPDLDSEKVAGQNIFPFYKNYFRKNPSDENGPILPLLGAEVDWHLWDKFGSLQLGLGLSYTYVTGKALELDDQDQPNGNAPAKNSHVSLHMYQLRPQLTYVFDYFKEDFPLVPYIRGALIGHGYMFFGDGKNEKPFTRNGTTIKPNGFRFGYQAAVGLMLMLDFLEPSSVRSARGEGLFEHVYLKGELSYTKIDSFHRPGFQFSAKDVMGTSLPLMWTFGLVFELP